MADTSSRASGNPHWHGPSGRGLPNLGDARPAQSDPAAQAQPDTDAPSARPTNGWSPTAWRSTWQGRS